MTIPKMLLVAFNGGGPPARLWLDSVLHHSQWANHDSSSVPESKTLLVPFLQMRDVYLSIVQRRLFFEEFTGKIVLQECPELIVVLGVVEAISEVILTPNRWLPKRLWVTLL